MEKINRKKLRESARDRHLKWINYYGSKNFGMWVECTKCKKWRRTLQYSESHEVPEKWCCSMLRLEGGRKGCCNIPEEESAELYLDYSPGTVVWAKVEGYPWWPAMVDGDPDTDEYVWMDKGILYYNVTFLDKKPSRAWIPERFVCPFVEPPKEKQGCLKNSRQYTKKISEAEERAEAALQLTIKDRLQIYSFVHSYKGLWPVPAHSEKCDIEANGRQNVESKTNRLIKETEELGHSDAKRIEKDLCKKEKNVAVKTKFFSKTPDILSTGKNTSSKKN